MRLWTLLALGALVAATLPWSATPAAADETLFADDFTTGLDRWQAVHGGSMTDWRYVQDTDISYVTTDAVTGSVGRYIVPAEALDLPGQYELRTTVRLEAAGTTPRLSVLTDVGDATTNITSKNLAVQLTGAGGMTIASPVSKTTVCTGDAPVSMGEWHDLVIRRANGISVVEIDGARVAAVTAPAQGGTIALSGYQARVSFSSVSVTALTSVPADHPAEPTGCDYQPPGDPDVAQPVLVNQSGFGLGEPKRFTAPLAEDGATFTVTDESGEVRFEGVVAGGVGDFTGFDPDDTGDFVINVTGMAGTGTSVPFGIGAYWIDRVSYRRAIEFMSGTRCYFGDYTSKADGPGIANDTWGHTDCMKAITWRDGAHYSKEIQNLVDLYLANPSAFEQITMPGALYKGLPVTLPADTPEIVRLIHWGVELLLDEQVNDPQLKEQLAAFVYAYPWLDEYIPRDVYERARDHLFATWGDPVRDRYFWQAFTPHTGDLFQVFTEVGTGKGELAPGHSVWPNLMMYEVARREGRDDAARYLQAAHDQAAWFVENLDLTDPRTTKGQRLNEYVLITGLVQFAEHYPDEVPAGLVDFVREWASVVVDRSDNFWDFRRYSDDRWTIPTFTGGGSEDPNETGNVAGFAAPALAAAQLLGDDPLATRLREIATAHVDNIFGRNPTGRHASFRAPTAQWGFEGVERGWFSEYQGGAGRLEGVPGVLDGSPKNAHYPFNPGLANVGHTEGWVAFNSAWNASLAWRAADRTSLVVRNHGGDPAVAVPRDATVTIELAAPLNLGAAGDLGHGEVQVQVGDDAPQPVTVTQSGPNSTLFTAALDLTAIGVGHREVVTVSYGYGPFARSYAFTAVGVGIPTS